MLELVIQNYLVLVIYGLEFGLLVGQLEILRKATLITVFSL